MTRHLLEANGIRVGVRSGWEVELGELVSPEVAQPRSLVHLANFALPVDRGDYGSGAVELMDGGGIFMVLMEFGTGVGQAMFADTGLPTALAPSDFSFDVLQRRLPGQAGVQQFFMVGERPFCLYVVLGSLRRAKMLVSEVNRTLHEVSIQ